MTDVIVEDAAAGEGATPPAVVIPAESHEKLGDVRETIGRHEERLEHHDEKLAEHEAKHAELVALFDEMKQQRQYDAEDRERLWTAHREAMEAIEALTPPEVAADIVVPPIETVVVVDDDKPAPENKAEKKGRLRLFGGK